MRVCDELVSADFSGHLAQHAVLECLLERAQDVSGRKIARGGDQADRELFAHDRSSRRKFFALSREHVDVTADGISHPRRDAQAREAQLPVGLFLPSHQLDEVREEERVAARPLRESVRRCLARDFTELRAHEATDLPDGETLQADGTRSELTKHRTDRLPSLSFAAMGSRYVQTKRTLERRISRVKCCTSASDDASAQCRSSMTIITGVFLAEPTRMRVAASNMRKRLSGPSSAAGSAIPAKRARTSGTMREISESSGEGSAEAPEPRSISKWVRKIWIHGQNAGDPAPS